MMWFMEILKVYLEEKLQIKYSVIKPFIIAKNPKCGGYQKGLASMIHKFFDKKTAGGAVKNEIM